MVCIKSENTHDDDDVDWHKILYRRETKARRGDGEYGRLNEEHTHSADDDVATPCTNSLGWSGAPQPSPP